VKQYIIIIAYITILAFLIGLFVSSYFTVGCKINLSQNEVIQGNDVDLFYEIDNKMLTEDIFNVEFKYWVQQGENIVVPQEIVEIPKISRLESYKSRVEVDLSNLDNGKYTIWTQTTYDVGGGKTGVGNRESKLLSLYVYII